LRSLSKIGWRASKIDEAKVLSHSQFYYFY